LFHILFFPLCVGLLREEPEVTVLAGAVFEGRNCY